MLLKFPPGKLTIWIFLFLDLVILLLLESPRQTVDEVISGNTHDFVELSVLALKGFIDEGLINLFSMGGGEFFLLFLFVGLREVGELGSRSRGLLGVEVEARTLA